MVSPEPGIPGTPERPWKPGSRNASARQFNRNAKPCKRSSPNRNKSRLRTDAKKLTSSPTSHQPTPDLPEKRIGQAYCSGGSARQELCETTTDPSDHPGFGLGHFPLSNHLHVILRIRPDVVAPRRQGQALRDGRPVGKPIDPGVSRPVPKRRGGRRAVASDGWQGTSFKKWSDFSVETALHVNGGFAGSGAFGLTHPDSVCNLIRRADRALLAMADRS